MISQALPGSSTLVLERTRRPFVHHAAVARTPWSRIKGLLGRTGLQDDEALILPHCRSIHMLGMRFPIDAVFVDRTWRVVALRKRLMPGRIVPPVWKAWAVVEAAAGTIERAGLLVGDQLQLLDGRADGREISPASTEVNQRKNV